MPRKSFFEDLRKHYLTVECKAGDHADCPSEIPPREYGDGSYELVEVKGFETDV
jgi:hypothetical protein